MIKLKRNEILIIEFLGKIEANFLQSFENSRINDTQYSYNDTFTITRRSQRDISNRKKKKKQQFLDTNQFFFQSPTKQLSFPVNQTKRIQKIF